MLIFVVFARLYTTATQQFQRRTIFNSNIIVQIFLICIKIVSNSAPAKHDKIKFEHRIILFFNGHTPNLSSFQARTKLTLLTATRRRSQHSVPEAGGAYPVLTSTGFEWVYRQFNPLLHIINAQKTVGKRPVLVSFPHKIFPPYVDTEQLS